MGLTLKIYNYQTYILILLWVSGMVKPFINTYLGNFDIVLFALFVACVDIVFQIATKIKVPSKEYLLAFLVILCLYIYIAISLTFTKSGFYGYEKTINLAPNLVFFLYSSSLKKINMSLFVKAYCILLIPLAFFFIYMKSIVWQVDNESTRIFKDLRNYYLSIGLQLGLLLILCYYRYRKVWLIALVFFLLIASSARAALLFIILTFIIFELIRILRVRVKKNFIYIGSVSLLFVVGLVIGFKNKLMPLLATSFTRFYVLFKGGGKSSTERSNFNNFTSFFFR